MAWLEDIATEYRKLNTPGKIIVAGVLIGAAVLGFANWRRGSGDTGSASNASPGGLDSSGTNPFTITTLTNPTKSGTPGPTKSPIRLPTIPKRTVNPPSIHRVQPIGPARPIQTAVARVTQAIQPRPNTNVTPKGFVFWNGGTRYSNGVSNVSPSEWQNRSKGHPIEKNGTFTGGR